MIAYFGRLPRAKLILWCYLAWYLAIVAQYFDPSVVLWLSSLGIGMLICFALNLATHQPGQQTDPWVVFRLFLIPFCVSSYSALIKNKGFFLLFPMDARTLSIGILACGGFVGFHLICRWLSKSDIG